MLVTVPMRRSLSGTLILLLVLWRKGITYSKSRKRVCGNFKAALIDPSEEVPKQPLAGLLAADVDVFQLDRLLTRLRLIVQNHGRDRVVLESLSENRPTGHCARRVLVTATQFDNDLWPLEDEVGDSGGLAGR